MLNPAPAGIRRGRHVARMAIAVLSLGACAFAQLDLKNTTVVTRGSRAPETERTAVNVLLEEVQKRTGLQWSTSDEWPESGAVIAIWSGPRPPRWAQGFTGPENGPGGEGYRLTVATHIDGQPIVVIHGGTPRGVLFGVGHLLRKLNWVEGGASLPHAIDVTTSPAYAIRGHQLGYRNRANSWDAWTAEQFDQHIRELALFGANCIENIPFQDPSSSPHMKFTREAANVMMSEICRKYDLDYWVWTPADFDLTDGAKRTQQLDQHEALYKSCPRLDAVFFPGGDPGNNHPSLVLPFLKDISERLHKYHPRAGVWLSLQGFDEDQTDYVFDFLVQEQPVWFTGIVSGPSSPPIEQTRRRLPSQYLHRHYPDITHSVRAQYPVQWWDPSFALTLGREGINPRPVYYAHIHNWFAPYTNGFLTYSDGVHDDVNKAIWSMRGWDPGADVREMLLDYTRFFFGPGVAEGAADGILALEQNWVGPIATNGGIDATLALWERLDAQAPQLQTNWRWQMCLLRAVYDAYQKHRRIYESSLEDAANAILAQASTLGPELAMVQAMDVLKRAETDPVRGEWRARIEGLCDALYRSIQLQTSVEKHQASGAERGCVLDFVDFPFNNRWWLEDEFKKVREMTSVEEQIQRLATLASWENPGPGSAYDDVGNVSKSAHVVLGEGFNTDPLFQNNPNPDHVWANNGLNRDRLSWQTYMDWPIAVKYQVDPASKYVVRISGQGEALTSIDGIRVQPARYGKTPAEPKEFPVPQSALDDGAIIITWERPDERHLNWRQRSRINEIWLLRQ